MQIVCLITLMLMNGLYLLVSFDMKSFITDQQDQSEEVEDITITSNPSSDFDLADTLLNLDIFDFDVEELAQSDVETEPITTSTRRTKDLVI